MFNEKLANAILTNNATHRVQLSQMDLDAEREGMAIVRRRANAPCFRGRRLLNKAPSRLALRV